MRNRRKALIFGANGQDGHYLNELLLRKGIEVTGISRSGPWLKGDVGDYEFVRGIIRAERPDYIFHLAANSTTRHDVWLENHRAICDGTLYILESVKDFAPGTKVFLSGSGLQFLNTGSPINETFPFNAQSPYAVCRIHSAYATRYYRSLGIMAYTGYFFNHDSPLRSERHISKKIAAFAQRVGKGANKHLEIGAVQVRKEWGFAGDIMQAVWMLVNQENIFETVIGTGAAHSIADWAEQCFRVVGKDYRKYITAAHSFTPEYDVLVSDPRTMFRLGWQPKVSFVQLARMMMADGG